MTQFFLDDMITAASGGITRAEVSRREDQLTELAAVLFRAAVWKRAGSQVILEGGARNLGAELEQIENEMQKVLNKLAALEKQLGGRHLKLAAKRKVLYLN